ncbi:amino acid transporter [Niveomyces insectorum RCEF 264]|uniref:Amino acid transporter n=1 Tax=Niveomyces insectorum RCEF 264 TaxID=1081102 RepID=A0A167UJP2_9HYPO|nr:amino acid transporter [Niveomyces insectorum RCEF 264]
MAPPPLTASSSSRPLAFLNGAISSAASPLQANFNLSCRSPIRPTHDGAAAADATETYPAPWSPSTRRFSTPLSPTRSAAAATAVAATAVAATGRQNTSSPFLEPPQRHVGPSSSSFSSSSSHTWPVSPGQAPKPGSVPRITTSTADNVDYGEVNDDDDDDDDDEGAVNDRSWFLPQPSPGLPPPLSPRALQRQDDGKLGVVSAVNIIVGKTIGVGAYSVPSAIFEGVGSVGMALLVWVLGSLISFCGLAVYLDLGTAIPKSGGERVYLERIFRRPRMLATCMFMAYVVLLGFSTPNAIVLGEYALYALDVPVNRWNVRTIAVVSVTLLCYAHARHPRLGLRLINVLGVAKMLMLVVVVLSGVAGGIMGVGAASDSSHTSGGGGGSPVMGHHLDADLVSHEPAVSSAATAATAAAAAISGTSTARRNFQDIWAGSSTQPYDYATALLKVIYCFRGYSTANQVLSDVRNPVRTLRVAAPLALVLVSLSYLAINVAFFLVVDKDAFRAAGVVVAGVFFRNIFGDGAGAHVLPLFVIVSAAGNIAATSFAQARVNEELARDGLLPFAAFWTSSSSSSSSNSNSKRNSRNRNKPRAGNAADARHGGGHARTPPARGLLLHWLVSVAVIVLPPPGKMYNFLVDIGGYPVSVISVAIASGLLYLHGTPAERWTSPWPASRVAIVVFAASNCLLLILPWIPPAGGRGENDRFASYAYPMTALAVIASGAVYWCWWRFRGAGRRTGPPADSRGRGRRGEHHGRTRRTQRLSPPRGWDLFKNAMAGLGGRGGDGNTGSQRRIDHDDHDDNDVDDDDDYHSARGLLSDEDSGSAEPMVDFANVRRRAPCGCPIIQPDN